MFSSKLKKSNQTPSIKQIESLYTKIYKNDLKAVKSFIEKYRLDLEALNTTGATTPLYIAAVHGRYEIATTLLELGACPTTLCGVPYTISSPIIGSITWKLLPMTRLLLLHSGDLSGQKNGKGETLLEMINAWDKFDSFTIPYNLKKLLLNSIESANEINTYLQCILKPHDSTKPQLIEAYYELGEIFLNQYNLEETMQRKLHFDQTDKQHLITYYGNKALHYFELANALCDDNTLNDAKIENLMKKVALRKNELNLSLNGHCRSSSIDTFTPPQLEKKQPGWQKKMSHFFHKKSHTTQLSLSNLEESTPKTQRSLNTSYNNY